MVYKVVRRNTLLLTLLTVLLLLARPFVMTRAIASGTLTNRYFKLSDNHAAKSNVDYEIGFDFTNSNTIGSIEIEFCSNDPFPATSCTVPPGFDISNAVLTSQIGPGDFVIDALNTNNHKMVLSRVPSIIAPSSVKFSLTNINNPTDPGAEYGRIQTFATNNASGIPIDQVGLAFNILGDLSLLTEVPPRLDFCVGIAITSEDCSDVNGDSIAYGELTAIKTSTATSVFNIGTNAANGYTVFISGTTLTSGNNTIQNNTLPLHSVIGVSQFGFNLVKNTLPAVGENVQGGLGSVSPNYANLNQFIFNDGDDIASSNNPVDYTLYTASYIVNINRSQPIGVYSTTLTYIAVGHF
jgi:hypothetical protein